MEKSSLKLIQYAEIGEDAFLDYILEWEKNGEKVVPAATSRKGRTFHEIKAQWALDETDEMYMRGLVPASLYFLTDGGERILGAIHLRHALNDKLLRTGGHIGYGIRPSERDKGYATCMLKLLLQDPKVRALKKVLLTCDDNNSASYRTIEHCNGVLWDKGMDEGTLIRRYWIVLEDKS